MNLLIQILLYTIRFSGFFVYLYGAYQFIEVEFIKSYKTMLLFISFVAKDRKIVREWICMALLGKTEKIKIFFTEIAL